MTMICAPRKTGLLGTVALATRSLVCSGRVAVAGGLVAAAVFGFASPAAAANIFDSEWADSTWTNSGGRVNSARLAPAEDSHNGAKTETLVTSITGTFCAGGASSSALVEVNLVKTEQATDLAGVTVDTFNAKPKATVSRSTSITGTITRTATKGKTCGNITGSPVTTTDPTVTLTGSWSMPRGTTIVTYRGTDCGGTGTCRYIPAAATGSFAFGGFTYAFGGTASERWMWSGKWDLDAQCSPVPGYPCS